jgi:hypothetical protein
MVVSRGGSAAPASGSATLLMHPDWLVHPMDARTTCFEVGQGAPPAATKLAALQPLPAGAAGLGGQARAYGRAVPVLCWLEPPSSVTAALQHAARLLWVRESWREAFRPTELVVGAAACVPAVPPSAWSLLRSHAVRLEAPPAASATVASAAHSYLAAAFAEPWARLRGGSLKAAAKTSRLLHYLAACCVWGWLRAELVQAASPAAGTGLSPSPPPELLPLLPHVVLLRVDETGLLFPVPAWAVAAQMVDPAAAAIAPVVPSPAALLKAVMGGPSRAALQEEVAAFAAQLRSGGTAEAAADLAMLREASRAIERNVADMLSVLSSSA